MKLYNYVIRKLFRKLLSFASYVISNSKHCVSFVLLHILKVIVSSRLYTTLLYHLKREEKYEVSKRKMFGIFD